MIFGSWVCTANGLGGFNSHLANPKEPETSSATRCCCVDDFIDQLDEIPLLVHVENSIQPKSPSELAEDLDQLLEVREQGATTSREAPIPDNHSNSIAESNYLVRKNSELVLNSDKFQFSDLIGNYIKDLKSIKRPRISNVKLLDVVDWVSRNIEGCIELAESTLRHHGNRTRQIPNRPSP